MSDFTPSTLTEHQIADIRLAASQMTYTRRRAFMAEMSIKYCEGKPRLTEKIFGFARDAVATGLGEKRTGLQCICLKSCNSGNTRWEEKHPDIAEYLYRAAEAHCQQDPTFETSLTFTRLTAKAALQALRDAGFPEDDLPSPSSMADILNRSGYRLRKVLKAKPLKKIKETNQIFENVKKKI
jgi:hypothetical protein